MKSIPLIGGGGFSPFTGMLRAAAEPDPNVTDPISTGCAVAGSTIECIPVSNIPTCLLRAVDGGNDVLQDL